MTTLYFSPAACSLSPHIALKEAGLTFSAEHVDLKSKQLKSGGDFLAINPKGQVPSLKLPNGEILTEGPAIVQWIADQAPQSKLAPANGTMARYRLQEWLNFISTEIHKGFSPLFNPATPDAFKAVVKEALAKKFAILNAHFSQNKFLMGDDFTVADGYCFTCVNWANFTGIDLSAYPNLQAYMARVGSRPKVQEAMIAEGLIKA
jgi:glutathione S-transferase